MELLTPLAPSSKDFTDDGESKIKFKYGEDIYNRYSINGKHTLIKNNDMILDNVGIQMMNEYVYELFGITPNIHRFMLGRTNICNMSLQNRKEFITSVSGIDFDYVNKVYNSLKKQLRDSSGVVKYINNNILSMKEYILSDVEVEKLVADKNEIKRLLVKLHENKRPDRSIINIDKPDMLKILKRTESVFETMKEYDSSIDELKSKYIIQNSKLIETNKKIIEISNILTVINDTTNNDIKDRMKEVSERIKELKSNILLSIDYLDLIDRNIKSNNLIKIKDIIELSMILGNETNISIEKDIESVNSKLIEVSNKHKELISDIDNTSIKITTYRSAMNGLQCPDCGFHFKENSVSDIIKTLETHIENIHSPKYALEKEIKEYNEILEDLNKKLKSKEKLEYLLRSINYSHTGTYADVYNFSMSLATELEYYNELTSLERELLDLSSKDTSSRADEAIALSKEYDILSDNINKLTLETNSIKKLIENHTQMENDLVLVNKYMSDVAKNRKYKINSLMNKATNEIIFELNNKLSKIETVLDKYNYMSKSTNENILELDKVNKDIELLELLIKELSPSTGLIAESLKSFLLGYVKDVNVIISNVWSYDMEVLPYDVKELEKGISYRFPVRVKGQKPVADVNDTSESMREIINI